LKGAAVLSSKLMRGVAVGEFSRIVMRSRLRPKRDSAAGVSTMLPHRRHAGNANRTLPNALSALENSGGMPRDGRSPRLRPRRR